MILLGSSLRGGLTLSGLELFVAMRGHLLELLGALARDRLIESLSLQRCENTLALLLQALLSCTSKFIFVLVAPSNLGLGSLPGLLRRTPSFQLSSFALRKLPIEALSRGLTHLRPPASSGLNFCLELRLVGSRSRFVVMPELALNLGFSLKLGLCLCKVRKVDLEGCLQLRSNLGLKQFHLLNCVLGLATLSLLHRQALTLLRSAFKSVSKFNFSFF